MFASFCSSVVFCGFNLIFVFFIFFEDTFLVDYTLSGRDFLQTVTSEFSNFLKFKDLFFLNEDLKLPGELVITAAVNDTSLDWSVEGGYIILFVLKSFFFIFLCISLGFINYTNTKTTNRVFFLLSSFFWLLYSEEEVGGIDDFLLVVFIFTIIFLWAGLGVTWLGSTLQSNLTFLSLCFFILVIFVLLIPVSTLIRYGVALVVYIRGASSSTSFWVEFIFDLLGVFIIFTRFVVQHIRFVLIFAAYIEFFEWSFFLSWINFNNFLQYSVFSGGDLLVTSSGSASAPMFFCRLLVTWVSTIVLFFYYFLHLFIVLIIQSIAYFLVAFWLFFFFYTAFGFGAQDKYFFSKR